MLTIRQDQMHVFEDIQLERFVSHAYGVVRRHWRRQAEAAGETATRARLRRLARQGRALGLVSVQDGLRFVNVAFALGDDFLVRYPWAARIAGNGHLSPAVRLELLVDRTAAWLDGEEVT